MLNNEDSSVLQENSRRQNVHSGPRRKKIDELARPFVYIVNINGSVLIVVLVSDYDMFHMPTLTYIFSRLPTKSESSVPFT
jgi:hypothetical protein